MRLITRGDFDGLACAVLLTEMETIDSIRFAHPKDIQDGLMQVTEDDIIANLPYVAGCGIWFDHHISEEGKLPDVGPFKGRYGQAPSAARLVYEYYDKPEKMKRFEEFLSEVDRMDSARLTVDDILAPKDWIQIAYTIDPRTNLGRFREYFLMMVDWIRQLDVSAILALPEVRDRTERVKAETEAFTESLKKHSHLDGNVIVTDFRSIEDPPVGNRFLIYTLFPEGNVSVRIATGKYGLMTMVAIGHSIFNRTCHADAGKLCAENGGGGHTGAGTCQLPSEEADEKIKAIIGHLKSA